MKTRKYKGGNVLGQLDPSVKLFETKYPEQIEIPLLKSLPGMGHGITARILEVVPGVDRSEKQNNQNYYWTNDEPSFSSSAKTPCNIFGTPNDIDHPHLYNCNAIKACYYLSEDTYTLDESIQFDLITPVYNPNVPYSFIHEGIFFTRRMNLFNMMYSTKLFRLLEAQNIKWANRHRLIAPDPFILDDTMLRRNVIGQLITPAVHLKSRELIARIEDVKFQMCIQDEYLYWTIETLLIHYTELVDAGIMSFKYTFSLGEKHMVSMVEFFPGNISYDLPLQNYNLDWNGHQVPFKTELLTSPSIVFYTRPQPNYTRLADILCRLFPDTFNISSGISRFNMRLNNNVSFSVDGPNEYKVNKTLGSMAEEYTLILKEITKNPEIYPLLETYSKLITGTTLMNFTSKGVPRMNLILSHNTTCFPYSSFKEIYTKYGFLKQYIRLPPYLDDQIRVTLEGVTLEESERKDKPSEAIAVSTQVNGGQKKLKRKTKKYDLLVGTKEEKEEYKRTFTNLDTCEKKCSQEKKIQNKQDAINGKILLTKKCNQDPKLNYKFDAYNQATWPFGDKYPTSPCIEEKQHLMNDPSFKYQKCMRHKCKNEREEFFKSRPTHANCVVS